MPYSSEHLAYTFSGNLPGGEIWSVTLRTDASSVVDPAALQSYADQAHALFVSDMWTAGAFRFYNIAAVTFNKTTVRHVSAAGLTTAQAEATDTSHAGGGVSQTAPNQGTSVISLMTARAGRSFRGRIYMPTLAPEWRTDGSGRVSSAMTDALATATGLFITDLDALTTTSPSTGPFEIAIQSKTSGVAPAVVTAVRCGDVLDTQRRRRDKLIENYSTITVSP